MTLQEIKEKINPVRNKISNGVNSRDFIVGALIILVGFASFGLGRLSRIREAQTPIEIQGITEHRAAVASTPPSRQVVGTPPLRKGEEEEKETARGGQVVASKSGAKYHFPWCAGASQIAEKNKVWFASFEEARKAGYTPASNCKGLQ